jgi:hypothetical protein
MSDPETLGDEKPSCWKRNLTMFTFATGVLLLCLLSVILAPVIWIDEDGRSSKFSVMTAGISTNAFGVQNRWLVFASRRMAQYASRI